MARVLHVARDDVRSLTREIKNLPAGVAPTLKRLAEEVLEAAGPEGDEVVVDIRPARSEWLTPKQVAEMFGVTERAVRKWCRRGTLKAVQPGGPRGDWRIPRSQFAASPEEVRVLLETVSDINRRFKGEVDDYER